MGLTLQTALTIENVRQDKGMVSPADGVRVPGAAAFITAGVPSLY